MYHVIVGEPGVQVEVDGASRIFDSSRIIIARPLSSSLPVGVLTFAVPTLCRRNLDEHAKGAFSYAAAGILFDFLEK